MAKSDTAKLLDRIAALESLLVCYRIGRSPTDALFRKLDKTKAETDEIKGRHNGDDG